MQNKEEEDCYDCFMMRGFCKPSHMRIRKRLRLTLKPITTGYQEYDARWYKEGWG